MYLISAILGSIVGAVGTALGGILALLIGKRVTEPRPFLAFAGGLMIAVVFFDMLLQSAMLGGLYIMCGGAVAGGIFFALVSPLIVHDHERTLYSTGILVLIGIALHDLPEGLAVGSSLVESQQMAISFSLLMLVHNIPEGAAVGLPLRMSGVPGWRVVLFTLLTGVPTTAGALIGTAVGSISEEMIAFCISFAAGAMLYISIKELIPSAGKNRVLSALLGFCIGFFMTILI